MHLLSSKKMEQHHTTHGDDHTDLWRRQGGKPGLESQDSHLTLSHILLLQGLDSVAPHALCCPWHKESKIYSRDGIAKCKPLCLFLKINTKEKKHAHLTQHMGLPFSAAIIPILDFSTFSLASRKEVTQRCFMPLRQRGIDPFCLWKRFLIISRYIVDCGAAIFN